jgi:DNA-binding CsgD family transcriptional regulator
MTIKRVTDEEKEQILLTYQLNPDMGNLKIADMFDVSESTVSKILRFANVEHRSSGPKKKVTDEIEQKIIVLYENHKSVVEIAKELILGEMTVRNVLTRNHYDLSVNKGRRKPIAIIKKPIPEKVNFLSYLSDLIKFGLDAQYSSEKDEALQKIAEFIGINLESLEVA